MYRDDTCILTARKVEFSWRSSPFSSPSCHAASLQQAWVRVKPGPGSPACWVSGLKVQHGFFNTRKPWWRWCWWLHQLKVTIYYILNLKQTRLYMYIRTCYIYVYIYIYTHHKSCFTASWWKGLTSNDQYIFWSISASEVVQTFHDELQLIILQGATGRWIKREWRNEARAGKNTHMRHHMQRTNKWQIRCVCLNFSLGNKHQVSSFCLGLDSVHKTQCNTGSTVTTSIHKWFFKKQLDLEMVLSTTPWDAMDHSAFFSPQKSGKENDQRDANRGDAKDIKKRLVSKASLGDRVRAEQNRLVPSSPEALPCTSEILPPQHLWTPNFFTSPDGEVGTGNLQKSELYGIMTYGFFFIALTCFHHKA